MDPQPEDDMITFRRPKDRHSKYNLPDRLDCITMPRSMLEAYRKNPQPIKFSVDAPSGEASSTPNSTSDKAT